MILVGFSITKVLVGVLCVSLALLLLFIAYRKFLAYLGKGGPSPKDYCTLDSLEKNPGQGEIQIFFSNDQKKNVIIEILNEDMSPREVIVDKEFDSGGHVIRFDSTKFPNGNYFYCLRTDNQKTMKKMEISNVSLPI